MQQQQPLPWLEITSAQVPAPGRDYFGPSERIERAALQGSKREGALERCRRGWVPMKYCLLKQCDLNYCNGSLPTAIQLTRYQAKKDNSTTTSLGIEVAGNSNITPDKPT